MFYLIVREKRSSLFQTFFYLIVGRILVGLSFGGLHGLEGRRQPTERSDEILVDIFDVKVDAGNVEAAGKFGN